VRVVQYRFPPIPVSEARYVRDWIGHLRRFRVGNKVLKWFNVSGACIFFIICVTSASAMRRTKLDITAIDFYRNTLHRCG